MVEEAGIEDFKPLILRHPYKIVEAKVQKVAVKDMANPLSTEFIILIL
jgi:hypothetical protein